MSGPRLLVIGGGRMARAILRTMPASVAGVLVRTATSADRLRPIVADARLMTRAEEIDDLPFDCVWILVSDRSVSHVAQLLAERPVDWKGRLALHSSGSETTETLLALATVGCVTAVVHPNATFSGNDPIPSDLVWTLSTNVPLEWRRYLEGLLRETRPILVEISDAVRPLYHAAACVASNYVVTLLGLAIELFTASGFDAATATAIVGSFARQAVGNTCDLGARDALTGPIARGDIDVVLRQLRAITRLDPQVADLFVALARATARLAGTSEAVSESLERFARETGCEGTAGRG